MITLDAIGTAQDCRVRPPAVPEELDHGDDNRQTDPGMAPSTATPMKQTIDSQNSQRWIRKIRRRSVTSIKPIAEAMTTAAKAVVGKCSRRFGAATSSKATTSAPTMPK